MSSSLPISDISWNGDDDIFVLQRGKVHLLYVDEFSNDIGANAAHFY
jgi:hypothetical protein